MQQSLFHYQGDKLVTNAACTACELSRNPLLKTNCMSGTGSVKPKYMFVGQAPGDEDDKLGSSFTGSNGRLLRDLLAASSIPSKDCFFTNCLKCALYKTSIKKTQWKHCKEHFVEELKRIQPTVIVAMGSQAFSWLTGFQGASKFYRRSLPCDLDNSYQVFPLRQPAQLFHCSSPVEATNLRGLMIQDLHWLKNHVTKMLAAGPNAKSDVDYKAITTPEAVDELFRELEPHDPLSCDIETSSLFPDAAERIVAIGFSWGPKIGRALPLFARGAVTANVWPDGYVENELYPRIRSLLSRKEVFGHNFIQFDQKWLRNKIGIKNCIINYDTQFAHYAIDEEQGTHDLEQVSLVYTDMQPWKREFTVEDTDALCKYLCKDVDATFRVKLALDKLLTDGERWLLKELMIPLAKEFFEVEYEGITVSEKNLDLLDAEFTREISLARNILLDEPGVRAFQIDRNTPFNPDSPKHVLIVMRDYLKLAQVKKTDGGEYSTDKEALSHHKNSSFVASLLKLRQLSKLQGTYCAQIRRNLRNGRVHTSYKVHGTVTGRPSSSVPNLMNIPKESTVEKVISDGKAIKKLFVPDPGHIFLQGDYSQAELRVLASISGDRELSGIFLRGEDAHTSTAASVYGITISQVVKAQRDKAKSINFGIPYGMSEESLIEKFVAEGSTRQDGEDFLAKHKRMFSGVWKYMDDEERDVRTRRKQTTALGRSRRYNDVDRRAIRQAYNYKIQSMASDLTLLSLIRIAKAIRMLSIEARTILTVYDSIAWSVHPRDFWRLASLVEHIMSSINFPWLKVPMVVDLEAGWNWGDLKPLDVKNRSFR